MFLFPFHSMRLQSFECTTVVVIGVRLNGKSMPRSVNFILLSMSTALRGGSPERGGNDG